MKFSLKSLSFATILSFPFLAFAAFNYTPLQPVTIPGGGSLYGKDILASLANIYTFAIAIAGGLAVIKIVWAGAKYMLSDVVTNKSDSIKEIQAAVYGLLMALGAFVFLYTLNPNLVKFNLNIKATDVIRGNAEGLYNIIQSSGGVGGVGGGTGGSGGGGGSGTIAQRALAGMGFPERSGVTNDMVIEMINESGILNGPVPSDAALYFPDGIPTAQGYLSLFASIAQSESNFNPRDGIDHSQGYDVGTTYSEGLFSLTPSDEIVKRLGYGSDEALANPENNTHAAIEIMKNQIQNEGSISGNAGRDHHYWGPLFLGK
jgi:hypothetical protein